MSTLRGSGIAGDGVTIAAFGAGDDGTGMPDAGAAVPGVHAATRQTPASSTLEGLDT